MPFASYLTLFLSVGHGGRVPAAKVANPDFGGAPAWSGVALRSHLASGTQGTVDGVGVWASRDHSKRNEIVILGVS